MADLPIVAAEVTAVPNIGTAFMFCKPAADKAELTSECDGVCPVQGG